MSDAVSFESSGDIAILRMDDGKANAVSPSLIGEINGALDQAESAGLAVLLVGRPGRFSAGFDLGVLREGGPAAGRDLIEAGARLALRIARFPAPVVLASTGHAIAMGAVLLMAADTRIGAEGDYKIAFNEVAIGMTTPIFLVELARDRMPGTEALPGIVQSKVYDPSGALRAGFYDRIVPEDRLLDEAVAEAERLAKLPRAAYTATRAVLRGRSLDLIEATLDADLEKMFSGT